MESYGRYLALAKRAGASGTHAVGSLRHQGWAHNSRGIVLLELQQNAVPAKAEFQKYLAAFESIVAKHPNDTEALFSLADAHAWIADAERALRKTEQALLHRKKQGAIIDRLLTADPANDVWLWSKIGADRAAFRLCFVQSDFKCATQYLDSARNRLRSRVFDTNNRDWLWQSAYVELDRGYLAEKQGAMQRARDALAQSKIYAERYAAASEGDAETIQILETAVKKLEQNINAGGDKQ
jgi:tetratricopeptide (TPR) repeat protein